MVCQAGVPCGPRQITEWTARVNGRRREDAGKTPFAGLRRDARTTKPRPPRSTDPSTAPLHRGTDPRRIRPVPYENATAQRVAEREIAICAGLRPICASSRQSSKMARPLYLQRLQQQEPPYTRGAEHRLWYSIHGCSDATHGCSHATYMRRRTVDHSAMCIGS